MKRGGKTQKIGDKGLSPVITTVLLIALTVVIISVIFLWFRGIIEEGVVKFDKNIQLVCDEVNFEATYSSGGLNIANNGNVPLFTINIRFAEGGNFRTEDIKELGAGSSWPKSGLNQGTTFSGDISGDVGGASKIIILPVLIGESSSGPKTYVCEGQYGKEIEV